MVGFLFKELIHILRTYFITFRYIKKIEISFFKNILILIVFIFLLKFVF